MKKSFLKLNNLLVIIILFLAFTACDNSDEPMGKGEVEFEITDGPTDDASVKSVFVTVTEVKVDGKSISGFTKQTIDLKAYTEGKTTMLGTTELDARTYSTVTLVLDLDTDATGNAPGCYVLTADDMKHKLKTTAEGTTEIVINKSWRVAKDVKSKIVIDFDLRKAIRYSDNADVKYAFVSDANLQAAVRLVAREKTGTIKGGYQESDNTNTDKIIVYAYKRGTFNASTEMQAQGEDNIMFKNAIASAEIKESLTGKVYTLAFLEEGEYELVFAGYSKNTTTGRFSFESRLQSETTVNGSVANFVTVKSGVTISLSTLITGTI